MPQGFDYPKGTQIWRPLPMDESGQRPRCAMRPMRIVNMLAGLQPKLNDNQLQAQLPDFDREHSSRVPEGFRGYRIP